MLFGAAIAAACIYLYGLFWLAARRDALADKDRAAASGSPAFDPARAAPRWHTRHSGLIFGLSLAVYCTSWTFYGGVGTAATGGLDYLPIYLGPILVFTFGFGLVRRILAQSKAQHSTSIADFLSARYGKSARLPRLSRSSPAWVRCLTWRCNCNRWAHRCSRCHQKSAIRLQPMNWF